MYVNAKMHLMKTLGFLQHKSRFSSARTIPWGATDITMWRARARLRSITTRGCADSNVPEKNLPILMVLQQASSVQSYTVACQHIELL